MINRVDAIFCGDIHLRETQPRARKDNFLQTQIRKLRWLAELAACYKVPIVCAGDVLHKWKVSSHFLYELYYEMPRMITILGNHDLPMHNLSRAEESGIALLAATLKVDCDLPCFPNAAIDVGPGEPHYVHFGQDIPDEPAYQDQLLVCHEFVYKGRSPWPGCSHHTDKEYLNKHRNWRTILIGDNHKTFTTKTDDGRLIVNCGSFTRMNIDQQDHRPCVFLWDANKNEVEPVYVPIQDDVWVVDTVPLSQVADTREELSAFIDNLGTANIGVSFTDNLQTVLSGPTQIKKPVRDKVVEWTTV